MTIAEDEMDNLAAEAAKLAPRANMAARAQSILDDELFRDAVEAVRDRLLSEFKSGKPENAKDVRLMYDALERVISALHEHMRDGQIVKARLDQINVRKSFLERLRA